MKKIDMFDDIFIPEGCGKKIEIIRQMVKEIINDDVLLAANKNLILIHFKNPRSKTDVKR